MRNVTRNLVIQFILNEQVICTAVFPHCGATLKALLLSSDTLDTLRELKAGGESANVPLAVFSSEERRLFLALPRCVKALSSVGACFTQEEVQSILNEVGRVPSFVESTDWEDMFPGHTAISVNGMQKNSRNDPFFVNILLDEKRVEFACLYPLSYDTIRANAKESHLSPSVYRSKMQANAVDIGSIDPTDMSYGEFDRFVELLFTHPQKDCRWLKFGKAYPYATTCTPMMIPLN